MAQGAKIRECTALRSQAKRIKSRRNLVHTPQNTGGARAPLDGTPSSFAPVPEGGLIFKDMHSQLVNFSANPERCTIGVKPNKLSKVRL